MNKVLFLDRDGTINVDLMGQYVSTVEEVKLIPNAAKAILKAKNAGFKISVITNQAGIAKGLILKEQISLIHRKIETLIATECELQDFIFDDIQICPHHPDDQCKCRKPKTGLLEASIQKLSADIQNSFFIGDTLGDIQCAKRMGIKSILVLTGHGETTRNELLPEHAQPEHLSKDLLEAICFILEST